MLDQDTARALMTIADETGARLALVGDRHQLPAVGRGGVLELAHRWADPAAAVDLDVVHRFTREITTADGPPVRVPDPGYSLLTLAMRDGHDPAGVFDDLHRRGLVRLHDCEADRHQAIADELVHARQAGQQPGHTAAVVVDTREQAEALNTAIRDRFVAAGLVDNRHTASGRAGQPVAVGDLVATRRNDHDLEVANRDTWTIAQVEADGTLVVSSSERGRRVLPPEYVRHNVELAYASTAHGAQGGTATTAHLILGEHSTAASAYVGMTRGRAANTVHLVAADLEQARDQWQDAFARDRADLGPAHAAARAAHDAAGYIPRGTAVRSLDQVLADLRAAWREQADRHRELQRATALRDRVGELLALRQQRDNDLAVLDARDQQARTVAEQARAAAEVSAAAITTHTQQLRDQLLTRWNEQREPARAAARVMLAGPGRLGHRLRAVNRATETLARWSFTWQPYLPDMPTSTAAIAGYASWPHSPDRIGGAFDRYARDLAQRAHPEHRELHQAADQAEAQWRQVRRDVDDARGHYATRLLGYGALRQAPDLEQRLHEADQQRERAHTGLDRVNRQLDRLTREPSIAAQPPGWLDQQHRRWHTAHATDTNTADTGAPKLAKMRNALAADAPGREPIPSCAPIPHDVRRGGPSLGL